MKILEEASEGNVGVWTDLPGKFIKGEMGDAIPLRLGRDTSDEGWDLNWDTIPHKNITLKAPFRLRLFPVDCARLFRAETIEVQKFIPPQEILNQEVLDIGGRDSHGLQWHVYPLWNENGILSISVEIDRNRLYVSTNENAQTPQQEENLHNFRTPHSALAHYEKNLGTKRSTAWRKFKNLVVKSRGTEPVNIPGFGMIYMKFQHENPKNIVWKFVPFESPTDEGDLITISAFQAVWVRTKTNKK